MNNKLLSRMNRKHDDCFVFTNIMYFFDFCPNVYFMFIRFSLLDVSSLSLYKTKRPLRVAPSLKKTETI